MSFFFWIVGCYFHASRKWIYETWIFCCLFWTGISEEWQHNWFWYNSQSSRKCEYTIILLYVLSNYKKRKTQYKELQRPFKYLEQRRETNVNYNEKKRFWRNHEDKKKGKKNYSQWMAKNKHKIHDTKTKDWEEFKPGMNCVATEGRQFKFSSTVALLKLTNNCKSYSFKRPHW